MASNPTPDDDDVLCALAEDLADGCHTHEVAIGIKQNTEAVIRAALADVTAAKAAASAAKGVLAEKHALHAAADEAGAVVLGNCRLRLVNLFGGQYGPQWEEAGFPDGSTAVPRTLDKRFALLGALKSYFTNHPAQESADLGATAAACTAAHTAVSNARNALNTAKAALSTALDAAKAAAKALRKRVRGLIDELGTLLPEDSVLYLEFGLNIPASPVAPEGIAELTLTALGSGRVLLVWTYSKRMGGTRILVRQVGIDDDFVSFGTVDALEKLLTEQTPGQTLEIKVVPYNDAGDGPASPVRTVVVT